MLKLFYRKSSLKSISKRSSQIFSIFTQTQKNCESLNAEIMEITNIKRQEAQALLDEVKELENVATKNINLAQKIQKFINGEPENQVV